MKTAKTFSMLLVVSCFFLTVGTLVKGQERIQRGTKEAKANFTQFDLSYESPSTVTEQLDGFAILFEGGVSGEQLSVVWDEEAQILLIERDGECISDLEVDYSDPNIIAWSGEFVKERRFYVPQFVGFLTPTSEDSFVLQLGMNDEVYRISLFREIEAEGGIAGIRMPEQWAACAKCVCFGKGTVSKCDAAACDVGTKCGATRACRWKSGWQYCER